MHTDADTEIDTQNENKITIGAIRRISGAAKLRHPIACLVTEMPSSSLRRGTGKETRLLIGGVFELDYVI